MKTFSLKQREIQKKWIIVDANGAVLGRLAAFISSLLRGKHKPTFTPHIDCGDNVIVINAKKLNLKEKKSKIKFIINTQVIPVELSQLLHLKY